MAKVKENTPVEKKKRGRPKKNTTPLIAGSPEPADVEKSTKKRGRPKKVAMEFSEEIQNVFNDYIEKYKSVIDMFLSYKDKNVRVSSDDWKTIYGLNVTRNNKIY